MKIINILKELRQTRKDLIALEETLIIQKQLCDEEPSSFAYSLAYRSLRARQDELNRCLQYLLSQRDEEVFKTRISGNGVGKGIIPIATLGDCLIGLQKVITNTAQSLQNGDKKRGKIPMEIIRATELSMTQQIEAASFGITLVGKTGPSLMSGSLLATSIECFFDLVNAGDKIENVIPLAGKIGNRSLNRYKEWISQLLSHKVNIETTWIDLEGETRHWAASPYELSAISVALEEIIKTEPVFKEIQGFLLGASLIRDRFEFISLDEGDKITGNIAHKAKPAAKECFGQLCNAYFQIETIVLSTGDQKYIWTLLDINLINEKKE